MGAAEHAVSSSKRSEGRTTKLHLAGLSSPTEVREVPQPMKPLVLGAVARNFM
jgi:hypothetical protein